MNHDSILHPMNPRELYDQLSGRYEPAEARALVQWVLEARFGLTTADIYSGGLERLTEAQQSELSSLMHRLASGEPIQYILGETAFCGRPFSVGPGVLIPRPETAELCQWIISENASAEQPAPTILDVGTGSGCIAVTLAADIPQSLVTAWDLSSQALQIASANASRTGVHVTFRQCDALIETAATDVSPQWDIIVSNPPYITPSECDEMAENVLAYEPHEALFVPADDPILFYRCIGSYAARTLRPGGQLFFELNPLTACMVSMTLREMGFTTVNLRRDQFGKDRFLQAKIR